MAQALRRIADVVVIDRDAQATSTGGYRLALNAAATAVLVRLLDPALVQQIQAVSDGADRLTTFTIANRRLQPIVVDEQIASEDRLLAQRQALRLLLTYGLEDRIHFGATVSRVKQDRPRNGAHH